jgi:hypothetical protein
MRGKAEYCKRKERERGENMGKKALALSMYQISRKRTWGPCGRYLQVSITAPYFQS